MGQIQQAAAALGAAMGANIAAKEAQSPNSDRDRLEALEQLVRTYGGVELVLRDGKIDVRCGGVATYASNLRTAISVRTEVEAARVTNKIMDAAGQANITQR